MLEIKVDARVEIHIHQHGDVAEHGGVMKKLHEILVKQKEGFMAVRQDLVDFAAKVDTATTAIATRIQALIDASTTLTVEEKSELGRLVDGLTAMGKDPANPTPPIP